MYNYKILLLEITKIFAILFLSKWCFNPYKVVKEKEVKVVSVSTDSKDAEAPVSAGVLDYNEAYCDIVKHILLSLLTCGVWLFIWIYKTTKALNKAPDSEQYDPTKKLLLCMFVPLYIIYWIYKHGIKIDKLNAFAGRSERNATLFLILGIFIPIVAVILMQDNINKLCVEVTPVATSTTVVTESTKQSKVSDEKHTIDTLKEYKELLDMGVITQEEYDAKKKQLLDL
jgi:hypothetical protein